LGTGISPFKEITLLPTATKALIAAMRVRDTKRLVCITGMGAGDSRGHGCLLSDRLIQPLLLRKVYEAKYRQEALVRDSGLEWVLVRPTMLNDKLGTGRIRALTDLSGFHGGTIPRRDVAHFVVGQITGNDWLRQAPLISS
jgi:NAD(P)H-binding